MRWTMIIILIALASCGGSLSKEQREEMREAQKKQEIKRVTEAELFEKALEIGKSISNKLKQDSLMKLDSLEDVSHSSIRWLDANTKNASEMEKRIFEAYLMTIVSGDPLDNLQKQGEDSLLYSCPIVKKLPDGSVEIQGMWNISLSKKDIVLAID